MNDAIFLVGLLSSDAPGFVAAEDFDGPHADALRRWQHLGFIAREPLAHPVPTCPHCGDGTPYRLDTCCICNHCRGDVDPRHLSVWPVNREELFARLADHLSLQGGMGVVDGRLHGLGTGKVEGRAVECFVHLDGEMSDAARRELGRYVRLLIFHGPAVAPDPSVPGRWVSLVELFDSDGSLTPFRLADVGRDRGSVRFDEGSGVLRVGRTVVGEVPVGSKECYLLSCLTRELNRFVPYAALKRDVLSRTGSNDTTDEATFCQKLKSRIKKSIPAIDRLIVTTNKGDGYRLRAEAEL